MQTASATALRPQRTRTLSCPFIYASLALRLDANTAVTDKLFQDVVSEALRQLYGYIGGSIHSDFLSITQLSATLRVDKRDWNKLWSALTLLTSYNGVKCTVEVITHSPFLQSLAAAS
ncbi:hypothetical protein WJX77_007556 [Trebouxia sp. C0004]